jgi:putative redox protein
MASKPFENAPGVVVVQGSADGLAQRVSSDEHRLSSDEPLNTGGTDTGPGPYDFGDSD